MATILGAAVLGALISLFTAVLMMPALTRKPQGVTSFTIGNNDIFDYTLCAQWLKENGTGKFAEAYFQIRGLNIYDRDKVRLAQWSCDAGREIKWMAASFGYLVRWLPVYVLAFCSSVTRVNPEYLYSLITILSLGMSLPLMAAMLKGTFGLNGFAAMIALCFTALSPHLAYVAYHGFLPQIMASALFMGLLCFMPEYVESDDFSPKLAALNTLFLAGAVMTYSAIVPYLSLSAGVIGLILIVSDRAALCGSSGDWR